MEPEKLDLRPGIFTDQDFSQRETLRREFPTTLQVNLGDKCNQNCRHCHVDASPEGSREMEPETADHVLEFIADPSVETLDLTGGAPELSPVFERLVEAAGELVDEVIVRTNLTVQHLPDQQGVIDFYVQNNVHLVASLPCYTLENVDAQRGSGVYEKSIETLKSLNEAGYGRDEQLGLDLVYNPGGAYLPPDQEELEADYKQKLGEEHDLVFDNLLTITNVPIKRFRRQLEAENSYQEYMELLRENYNPEVLEQLMCRHMLSVGSEGRVYDCDFNQALGWSLKNSGSPVRLKDLEPGDLAGKEILTGSHCLACTAGAGSSCGGTLDEE